MSDRSRARTRCARASALVIAIAIAAPLQACGDPEPSGGEPRTEPRATSAAAESTGASPRVSRRDHQEGLAHCGDVLVRIEGPEESMSFARLMRECSGLFARRRCRDALAADVFSRDGVAEACRADYCDELPHPPSFCTVEMPTDAEFLSQFGRFSRAVLRRDLRRILDAEGAREIAELFADLIESHAERQ